MPKDSLATDQGKSLQVDLTSLFSNPFVVYIVKTAERVLIKDILATKGQIPFWCDRQPQEHR